MDPVTIITLALAVAGAAGIAWATARRQRVSDQLDSSAIAITNWREIAESREAMVRERDAQIAQQVVKMAQLESRIATMEAEILELKRHDLATVTQLLLDMSKELHRTASNVDSLTRP